jgi:uncharacterized protein (TIGR03435 family)
MIDGNLLRLSARSPRVSRASWSRTRFVFLLHSSQGHREVRFFITAGAVLITSVLAGVFTEPRLNAQVAQAADQNSQAFAVASVRVNRSGRRRASLQMLQPNGFSATNTPLTLLIATFYRVPTFRLVGGPEWVRSDRFDITATLGFPVSMGEKRSMGRALLEDRFKLKTHRETREGRIYTLLLAREDHRLGPRLTPSTVDCPAILGDRSRGETLNRFRFWEGGPPPCVAIRSRRRIQGNGIQIDVLASTLGALLRETVVDRTGLTGPFNVDMVVALDPTTTEPPEAATRTERIFIALQEQLGLKLEPTKGPVDVLVIDHVEKPTPD